MEKFQNIQNYLNNQSFNEWVLNSSKADSNFWNSYLHQFPEETLNIQKAKLILKSLSFSHTTLELKDRNDMLSHITSEINSSHITNTHTPPFYRKYIMHLVSVAAGLALLFFAFNYNSGSPLNYSSFAGSIAEVSLDDGSIVTLQGESTIWLDEAFANGEKRIVHLANQAFFDINSSPTIGSNEFTVVTSIANIDVLGTKFLVDVDYDAVTVVVEEGKVRVTPKEVGSTIEPVYLTAGDKLVLRADQSISVEKLSTTKQYTSIKDGAIVFEGATTREFVESLEDYFGYQINAPEALLTSKRAFDGTFPTQNIDLILQAFSTSFGVSHTYNGQEIQITYSQKD